MSFKAVAQYFILKPETKIIKFMKITIVVELKVKSLAKFIILCITC